ncbi:hypothetical protein BHE74_00042884 [Ensete ventricosum]|nr:hypothetical protein BHE74_00042884 [Ensete ventricosum]
MAGESEKSWFHKFIELFVSWTLCCTGKAPYYPVHTGIGTRTGRYRTVSLKSAVGGRLTEKSTVDGRLKKKKGKEEEKKKEVPSRRPRLRAARAPSPPAGRPRDVAALAARG